MSTEAILFISYALLWLLVLGQTLVLLGAVRLIQRLVVEVERFEGQGAVNGRQAPSFRGEDIAGRSVDSADFHGRSRALLFVSAHCPSCVTTLDEVAALSVRARGPVIAICRDTHARCAELVSNHQLDIQVVVDAAGEITDLYEVTSVPTAVLIGPTGNITFYGHPHRDGAIEQELHELTLAGGQ
jgi:peroxiredoxin